jgi:hypothetical protein
VGSMATDPRDDLKRLEPYLADVRQAADEERVGRDVLAAVGLRETWAGWAPGYFPRGTHLGFGDSGHGFGLFQADLRTWEPALRGLIPGVDLLSPLGQARLAARHLASSLRLLHAVFPALPTDRLLEAAVCAYNARIGAVAAQLNAGKDPNLVTTKGPSGVPDYGRDVLARAERLRRRAPSIFPPPAG